MTKLKPISILLAAAIILVGAVALFAQTEGRESDAAKPAKLGTAHLWADVGSFQLEGYGTVKVKFTGTLLVVKGANPQLPKVTITGKVRKEFESEEMGRVAWFGTGEATITGAFRHLTVFGKQMDATWHGRGIAQVFGEFDARGKTGNITIDGSQPFEWTSTGQTFYIPSDSDPRFSGTRPSGPAVPAPKPGSVNPSPKLSSD